MTINELLPVTIDLINVASPALLVALSLAWLALRLTRTTKNVTALRSELTRLQDLLHAQGTVLTGMGTSLQRLQAHQQNTTNQLEELEQVSGQSIMVGGSQVYRQAINLAVDGVAPKELTERFGLSRGEAELMVSFHQLGEKAA